MKFKECPICEMELISGIGLDCMMCGMQLDIGQKDFCSEECESIYGIIHKYDKVERRLLKWLKN